MKAAPHVLVVDDEPQIRRFLDIGYRAQGYRVSLAGNAAEALEALAGGDVDLLVLDLGLPDRDGSEVLHDLRGWSDLPVIVLTGHGDVPHAVRAMRMGGRGFHRKAL